MIPCSLFLLTAPLNLAPIHEAIESGSLRDALAKSNALLAETPEHPEVLCTKGRILAYMGRYDAAETVFRSILSKTPAHPEALLGSAYVALWASDMHLAEKRVKELLKSGAHRDDAQVLRARIAIKKKDWNGAIAYLTAAQSDNPHYARHGKEYYLLYAKTQQAIDEKDFDAALAILDTMHHNWPNDERVLLTKARVLAWQGHSKESIKIYSRVINEHPDSVEARVGLAQGYLFAKRYPDAKQAAHAALSIDKENKEAQMVLATAQYRMGEGPEVQAEPPQDLQAAYKQYNLRQYRWALEEVEKVLEKKPNYPEALLLRANIFMRLSLYDKARESFNKVLAQNPTHTDALQGKGGLDMLEGKFKDAFDAFSHIKESDPYDLDSRSNFFALQPLVEREIFLKPTLSSEKEKDLVTGIDTTRINTIDGIAKAEGMIVEGVRAFAGLEIFNQQMENLIAPLNNYNAVAYTPLLGIRYTPSIEFELLVQGAFASYRDADSNVLFPFQDRFLFQPKISARYIHDTHFLLGSLYQDGLISRNFSGATSQVQRSTHFTGAYEYRFGPPYNGFGLEGELATIGSPYTNTFGKGELWLRGSPWEYLRLEARGGLASFEEVVPNYFSYIRKWKAEGTVGLFYAVRNETFVELSYRARIETLSSLSNQGIAVTNPATNVPQDLQRKNFFSNRVVLDAQHVLDEDFRFEGMVFYDQVNAFYSTVGGSVTLRAFF